MKRLAYRLAGGRAASAPALALTTDAFLTVTNILNVLRQASLTFLIASGLTLAILTAGLDLSVGANVGLSACLAAHGDEVHRLDRARRRRRAWRSARASASSTA